MKSVKKTITICSSATGFKRALEVQKELQAMGFKVLVPKTANVMKKNNDFEVSHYKTWFKSNDYSKKTKLILGHFKKVLKSDAILITNYEKDGIQGNIGGNTLIEMTVAFLNKIPIYVLNPIDENLSIKEEVYGLQSIFLNGDLNILKKKLR